MRSVDFTYDLAGRVLTQSLPESRDVNYAYDANSNLISLTPPGQPAHSFDYTPVDLETSYTPPDVGAGLTPTTTLYNADRQPTQINQPGGVQISFGYDSGGRLSSLTQPRGQTNYAYSPTTGNLSTVTAPDGSTLTYSYDGSLLTRSTWAGTVAGYVGYTYNNDFNPSSENINGAQTVNFTYDADGLLTQAGALTLSRSPQTGLINGTTLGSVSDTQTYNSFGELSGYQALFGATELFNTQYTRDALGRITEKVETVTGQLTTYDYEYDQAGRLTDVSINGTPVSHYTYDANGNRLSYSGNTGVSGTGTYDSQDRLNQYASFTYSYTANGELLSKTDTTTNQTTSYTYDALGNLLSVVLPDGTRIDYIIDGQNRRVGKKVNGTLVQGFLYAGQLNPIAELDGSNTIVSRFVYGSKTNVPDYMVKGGVTYRIVGDHLGSSRLIVNTVTGTVEQRMAFDEFGNVIEDTNPGFQPFGFAGGIYDQDTKLVRFGTRDYDAASGKWTVKDPLGIAVGNSNLDSNTSILGKTPTTNLYQYSENNPVNLMDPLGLFNIIGGGGFSAVAITGVEASTGIVINPGLFGQEADIGGFLSFGPGVGVNVSADWFLGFVRGGIENVNGETVNLNIIAGPASLTIFIDPKTGDVVGGTMGLGPSATPIGASASYSITRTLTLRDILKLILGRGREVVCGSKA
jgi:RHS repeat-associated protein